MSEAFGGFTRVDLVRESALISFVNPEKEKRLSIAMAFIESINVGGDACSIMTISGREYWVPAIFYDDVSTWWVDYLSGRGYDEVHDQRTYAEISHEQD